MGAAGDGGGGTRLILYQTGRARGWRCGMSEGDVLSNEKEGGGLDGESTLRPAEPVSSEDGGANAGAGAAAPAAPAAAAPGLVPAPV